MAESQDRFLGRWSRRKHARRGLDQSGQETASPPVALSENSQPELPDEAETAAIVESLPDIESLDENADFTAFLQEGVPEALRRQALRKLWRLNPIFANLDGLNDYDEDFTLATSALTHVKTLYQVGKGMPDAPEPEEDEVDETEIPASEMADSGESADDPEVEDQAALSNSAGEGLSQAVPAATELPLAEPVTVVAADAKPAKSGSAAERRWGRFKG